MPEITPKLATYIVLEHFKQPDGTESWRGVFSFQQSNEAVNLSHVLNQKLYSWIWNHGVPAYTYYLAQLAEGVNPQQVKIQEVRRIECLYGADNA